MHINIDGTSVDAPNNVTAWGYDYEYGRIRCTRHVKSQQYTINTNADGVTSIRNSKGLKVERPPYYFFTNQSNCEEAEFEDLIGHLEMLQLQIKKYKAATSGLLKKNSQLRSTQVYQDLMTELHKPI